jgi:hypothetical protein
MEFKAVIFRDDEDKMVQMFLLDDQFNPFGMPSLCISDGVYKEKLTTKNFYICRVDFIPNRRFDGKFEVLKDFDKFDYMISGDMCFEVDNKENEDFTVHQMLRDGKLWNFVKYLANQHNLSEVFETDTVGETIKQAKEDTNEV